MPPLNFPLSKLLPVTRPRSGIVFEVLPPRYAAWQAEHGSGEVEPAVAEVTWLVDARQVASVAWPYEASWPLARGRHRLEMVAGGRRSDAVEFEVR